MPQNNNKSPVFNESKNNKSYLNSGGEKAAGGQGERLGEEPGEEEEKGEVGRRWGEEGEVAARPLGEGGERASAVGERKRWLLRTSFSKWLG